MMKQRRGQMAIFLVMVVVIVVLSGMFIYFAVQSGRQQIGSEQDRTQLQQEQIDQVKNYVDSCVGRVAREGLDLLGMHGGVIPVEKGGTAVFDDGDRGNLFLVHEGIPVSSGIVVDSSTDVQSNALLLDTARRDLEAYIPQNIEKCTGFSDGSHPFSEQGYDISWGSGDPRIVTGFDVTETSVQYFAQLAIVHSASGTSSRVDAFSARVPVRFREIYEFAVALAEADISDPGFDIILPAEDVFVTTPFDDDRAGSLVKIKDDREGSEYTFEFGRANRKPVIEGFTVSETSVEAGSSVSIDFTVYDADEQINDVNLPTVEISPSPSRGSPFVSRVLGDDDAYTATWITSEDDLDLLDPVNPASKSYTVTVYADDDVALPVVNAQIAVTVVP